MKEYTVELNSEEIHFLERLAREQFREPADQLHQLLRDALKRRGAILSPYNNLNHEDSRLVITYRYPSEK